MPTVQTLAPTVGVREACRMLGIPRSGYYRFQHPAAPTPAAARHPAPPRALSAKEQQELLDLMNSPRFVDQAPPEIYATLMDEEQYVCSIPTMYRVLRKHRQSRERRDQLRHPTYTKPQLLATGPNQVWSWDITLLLGPVKWSYFYLYVILDIYSRYVVGWMIALRQSGDLAEELVSTCYRQYALQPGQLTLHADNGKPMLAKPLAFLMADLGITESHSRPYTSDDNPFSEAAFKTLKYRPDYPKQFGDRLEAEAWARDFFQWYNWRHHHSGIGLLTPGQVHFGQAPARLQQHQRVLDTAYAQHPERFVHGQPHPLAVPQAVWINPPPAAEEEQAVAKALSERTRTQGDPASVKNGDPQGAKCRDPLTGGPQEVSSPSDSAVALIGEHLP